MSQFWRQEMHNIEKKFYKKSKRAKKKPYIFFIFLSIFNYQYLIMEFRKKNKKICKFIYLSINNIHMSWCFNNNYFNNFLLFIKIKNQKIKIIKTLKNSKYLRQILIKLITKTKMEFYLF